MNVLIKIFCLMLCLPNIKSDCTINYVHNTDNLPKFEKMIGKFNIFMPIKRNEPLNYIKLIENESIRGFCDTYFRPISYVEQETKPDFYYRHRGYKTNQVYKLISNLTTIVLKCQDNELYYNNVKIAEQELSCMEHKYAVYSTEEPFHWCESNQNSSTFLFAAEKANDQIILAGICYNRDQLSLETLVYNTTIQRRHFLNEPMDKSKIMSSKILGEDLWNFKTSMVPHLSQEELQLQLAAMGKIDEWLNLANYEISPIVQDEVLMKYFNGYENMLNAIWWHNLRVGNWKRFHDTLKKYGHNNSYELYVGSSGVVKYPAHNNNCHSEKYLNSKLEINNQTIPAYMWTYLKSYDNLNKEFVIFGYNSPFAEFFTTEGIIFCPDICVEIPWLKGILESFRYANAGIMFCCSTDFLRQTDNDPHGFPVEILMPPQFASTAETELEEFTTLADNNLSTEENIIFEN